MNVRHPMGVLHLFSIKNIFYDKMDWRLYFDVAIYLIHLVQAYLPRHHETIRMLLKKRNISEQIET